jgi:hypothetical protein
MALAFLSQVIFAVVDKRPISLTSESLQLAILAAAWHLKWVLAPVAVVILWGSVRIYRSMLSARASFVGMRAARGGLLASALVILTVTTLIAVTVPRRLRERQMSIDAGVMAQGYTLGRAQLEYRTLYGTLPAELKDLRQVPDPNGAIAAALAALPGVDSAAGYAGYKPSADVASSEPPRALRVSVIRTTATTSGEETSDTGVSFTNYDLRLPGPDNILDTDDDLILRDGMIMKASDVAKPAVPATHPVRTPKR